MIHEMRPLEDLERELGEALAEIRPADQGRVEAALRHWDAVAHPLHSLGLLEDAVARLAGAAPLRRDYKKCVAAFCADNGVVAQGVTQTDSSITAKVAKSMLEGASSVCCMARVTGADVFPVDAGMAADVEGMPSVKVAYGTRDLAVEPAMTRRQALHVLLAGMDMARDLKERGYSLLSAGEMGIGNTTTTSAVAAALLGRPAGEVTGKGAGLSNAGLEKKIAVIDRAIALHRPDPSDPVDVLSKVGGFDIAGMTGFYLGCARYGVPAVLDGFISTVAALTAQRLCPAVTGYLTASHLSAEPGARYVMEELGMRPMLRLGMALGEGTGAVTAMPLIDMALRIYYDMPSFDSYGMEAYRPL